MQFPPEGDPRGIETRCGKLIKEQTSCLKGPILLLFGKL